MFTNTGNLSFYLGISFIGLAFLGLLSVVILVIKSKIDPAKIDKLIEVGKWFIVSVAIVVGASIISDGFKEREQDIKEIMVFDKYTATVTKADGLEERRLLAEYFATVAPPGALRESWKSYKELTDKQIEKNMADIAAKAAIDALQNPTDEQKLKSEQLAKTIEAQNKPLISQNLPPVKPVSEEWLIIAGGDSTIEAARNELNKARKVSPDARIYKKGNMFRTVIPNFANRDEANRRLPEVKRVVNSDAYINVLKNWCTSVEENGDFLICN
jgi:hypothetical protein